jgi:hypothetical protein
MRQATQPAHDVPIVGQLDDRRDVGLARTAQDQPVGLELRLMRQPVVPRRHGGLWHGPMLVAGPSDQNQQIPELGRVPDDEGRTQRGRSGNGSPSFVSGVRHQMVFGEAIELQKNRACHAYSREHDKSRYGHKQPALSPKYPDVFGTRFHATFILAFRLDAACGIRVHDSHRWPS